MNDKSATRPCSFQVVDEASEPGNAAFGIGPDLDVFVYALENRAAQLECGVDFVQGCRKLQVESSVVFREHLLAVRLFSHLHI